MTEALLDTDIYSEVSRVRNPTVSKNAKAYLLAHGRFTISAMTVFEVVGGFQRAQRTKLLREFLDNVSSLNVLQIETEDTILAGRIHGDLGRRGLPIGHADPIIAASAIRRGLTVVTGNQAHFARIQDAGYPLLLTNWREG